MTKINIDWNFIHQLEGFELTGYVPQDKNGIIGNSGVTIGAGFDLGQFSKRELQSMDIPANLIAKFEPYLGLKKYAALLKLKSAPLRITMDEFKAFDEKVKNRFIKGLDELFAKVEGTGFFQSLDSRKQTVVFSVAYQYGLGFNKRCPTFFRLVCARDWDGVYNELMNFGDRYTTRRKQEAKYLKGQI